MYEHSCVGNMKGAASNSSDLRALCSKSGPQGPRLSALSLKWPKPLALLTANPKPKAFNPES